MDPCGEPQIMSVMVMVLLLNTRIVCDLYQRSFYRLLRLLSLTHSFVTWKLKFDD